jgi:DNA polymerase-3 subunit gamma/tau
VLQALQGRDGIGLLGVADDMLSRSLAFDAALQDLATLLHRVALAQTVPQAIAEDEPERVRLLELAQSFSAEEIQLYYQIAIHGRNEIDLAPDEYAGFTMTLLRMLAFRPAGAKAAPEQRTAEVIVTPVIVAPLKAPATALHVPQLTPQSQPVQTTLQPVSPVATTALALDWSALLAQLNVQGMARELAKHCTLENYVDGRLTLNLAPQHKHLLTNKLAQEKLQSALADYFVQPVRLVVVLGVNNVATPAAVEQHVKQTRQQQAVEAITQDPFVLDAQTQLGAQILEETIKSIQ